MNRFARVALSASLLSTSTLLAGCGSFDPSSFDPTAVFDMEIFNTKKKLPGERKPVFPEGTPGVPQGVPQELVKGYQDPAAQSQEAQAATPAAGRGQGEAQARAQAESRGQAEGRIDPDRSHGPAVRAATASPGAAASPGAVATAVPSPMA